MIVPGAHQVGTYDYQGTGGVYYPGILQLNPGPGGSTIAPGSVSPGSPGSPGSIGSPGAPVSSWAALALILGLGGF